ncbi:MAG TPA: hypothetical protein VGI10_26005 [Polyangiaceae bacterium]|jgi:predicted transcriptional regulator
MKQILIELDDRLSRDLERVAPARERVRAEFVRRAIRVAIDIALDRATGRAYARTPLARASTTADLAGWDSANLLKRTASKRTKRSHERKRAA